jgi:hypothetical protein
MVEETTRKDYGKGFNAVGDSRGRFDRGAKMVHLDVDVELE